MRRTTILLDDDLADQLDYERRRRNQSTTAIVRQALTEYLAGGKAKPKKLGFIGLGRSRGGVTAQNMDEFLAREWPAHIYADSFNLSAPRGSRKKRAGSARRGR